MLLTQFRSIGTEDQPNIFLFDIQPDQTAAVAETVRSLGLPVIQEAPIVTMKLAEVKGRKTGDILADPTRKIPEWQLQRDYRSTYRATLSETEKVVDGKWIGQVENYQPGDVVPISFDREIARDMSVTVGDELVFDVQGVPDPDANRKLARDRLETFSDELFRRLSGGRFRERADFWRAGESSGGCGGFGAFAGRGGGEIPERLGA